MSLFIKECGQVMRGVLYLVYVGAIVLFFITQFMVDLNTDLDNASGVGEDPRDTLFYQPRPGEEDYGSDPAEIPEQVMPNVISDLLGQHGENRYPTYPIGFIRVVRLNEGQQAEVAALIEQVTGYAPEALYAQMAAWQEENTVILENDSRMVNPHADATGVIPIAVDYGTFKQRMAELDAMLGGGSSFDPQGFAYMGSMPLTYGQAQERYRQFVEEDRITGAYARLFCDYLGVAVALFAVFVPVGYLLRDRRAGIQELVFSRRISSARLILTRYAASMAAILLPLLLLAILPTVRLLAWAGGAGLAANPFSFFLYTLGWIGPTALTACSVGFFFTTLTGTPVGIVAQFLWSFFALMGSVHSMVGGYGAQLLLRHNTMGGWHLMAAEWGSLVANRLGYTVFALVLLGCSILFYELQRRGRLDLRGALGQIFRRRKGPVPADAVA